MQRVVEKIWWRRSTPVEVSTSTRSPAVVQEVISTNTNILAASIRTLLCQQALQQPDLVAGWRTFLKLACLVSCNRSYMDTDQY